MIITRLNSGLGNQLFQYAIGRCLANRLDTELKLDTTLCVNKQSSHHECYKLSEFNIQENLVATEEIGKMRRVNETREMEKAFFPEILNLPDNIFLSGYWQNEQYFCEIRDILLKEFTLKNSLSSTADRWKKKILSADCAVSVHIRQGDYLTALIRDGSNGKVLSYEYYVNAINQIKNDNPDLILFFFSDDISWVKNNLNFGVPAEFVEGCESDVEELYLMSLCKHNIIANSTFSWWGAWLNQNPDKKVFMQDIFKCRMKNSIKIPVNVNQRSIMEFPPSLSIIVFVENNLASVNFSLKSIVNQKFKDYEIILVDSSTDETGKFCRQFVENANVNILNTSSSSSKPAAWNRGLEVARGEYALFLTLKDFILPFTAKSLAQILYNYLKIYLEPKNKYLTFFNYGKNDPNIICTTQSLEENEKGNINMNGLPDKKFSIKVDNVLKNLNALVELNPSDEEKLMALSTRTINRELGTKFFKRSFLNENNIRFRTGGGYGRRITLPCRCLYVYGKNYVCAASFLRAA